MVNHCFGGGIFPIVLSFNRSSEERDVRRGEPSAQVLQGVAFPSSCIIGYDRAGESSHRRPAGMNGDGRHMDTKTSLCRSPESTAGRDWGSPGDFESAVADLPAELRFRSHGGLSHTPWRLVEHLRIAQRDILDFSRSSDHGSSPWPDGYWFDGDAPPTADAWDSSVEQFPRDLTAMQDLVSEPSNDLFAPIPRGRWPDDSPRSPAGGRPQCVPHRTTGDASATPGRLVRNMRWGVCGIWAGP